jgi:ABC-type antimicrobial peptide transport system ATPase subunit
MMMIQLLTEVSTLDVLSIEVPVIWVMEAIPMGCEMNPPPPYDVQKECAGLCHIPHTFSLLGA